MASVKLYIEDQLAQVQGLNSQRALAKMDGNIEVYSTLLDKYLNELPRTIPRLRKHLREENMYELTRELRDLRIDLADIFAQGMMDRANIMYEAAEKGDLTKCKTMAEPIISALQTLAYEIKQCRTQELLENAEDAAQKAAEMDIGNSIVNNKYATIPKAKFIELYRRIDNGLLDKALNLANVLKAMGYDSEISSMINLIISDLNNMRQSNALQLSGKLVKLLGASLPESAPGRFTLLVIDTGNVVETMRKALGKDVNVVQTQGFDDTVKLLRGNVKPGFIIVSKKLSGHDGGALIEQLKRSKLVSVPMGMLLAQPTSQDILDARKLGVQEFFILPLDLFSFADKINKYKEKA